MHKLTLDEVGGNLEKFKHMHGRAHVDRGLGVQKLSKVGFAKNSKLEPLKTYNKVGTW